MFLFTIRLVQKQTCRLVVQRRSPETGYWEVDYRNDFWCPKKAMQFIVDKYITRAEKHEEKFLVKNPHGQCEVRVQKETHDPKQLYVFFQNTTGDTWPIKLGYHYRYKTEKLIRKKHRPPAKLPLTPGRVTYRGRALKKDHHFLADHQKYGN